MWLSSSVASTKGDSLLNKNYNVWKVWEIKWKTVKGLKIKILTTSVTSLSHRASSRRYMTTSLCPPQAAANRGVHLCWENIPRRQLIAHSHTHTHTACKINCTQSINQSDFLVEMCTPLWINQWILLNTYALTHITICIIAQHTLVINVTGLHKNISCVRRGHCFRDVQTYLVPGIWRAPTALN